MLGSESRSVRVRPVWLQHQDSIHSPSLPILPGGDGGGRREWRRGEGWGGGEIEMLKVVCF